MNSQNIRNVYFNIDAIYRHTKILRNIRQTDFHDTLEELRILSALRSGVIVICETAPYKEKTLYSKFIIWGALEDLPKLVESVEKNYKEIHKSIFGLSSENSPFIRRMKRIEICNALAMQRAVNRLNSNKN